MDPTLYGSTFGQVTPAQWSAIGSGMPSMSMTPDFGSITGMQNGFSPNINLANNIPGLETIQNGAQNQTMFSRLGTGVPNQTINPMSIDYSKMIAGYGQTAGTGFSADGQVIPTTKFDIAGYNPTQATNPTQFNPIGSSSNPYTIQYQSGPMTGKDYAQLGFQGLGALTQFKGMQLAEKAYDTETARNKEYDAMYKEDRQAAIDKANRLRALKF